MKTLQKTFVMNADKCGNHNFTQIRREGNICCYQRNKVDNGKLHSIEVFIVKVIKAGAPLPGGGRVEEDYEQYPGAHAFGRSAWSTNTVQRANQIFDGLLAKTVAIEEDDESELVTVARVSQPKGQPKERKALKWPEGPFTQKQLAAHNSIDNYKEVYTDLQRALASGVLKISEQVHDVARGRSAKMFEMVAQTVAA
jgi:hypothetical protein